MTYSQILTWLLTFGAKLPQIVALIQQLIALFQSTSLGVVHMASHHTPLSLHDAHVLDADPAIRALEQQVLAAYKGHGPHALFSTLGDGSILAALRNIMTFVKDNPQIWAFIVKLLPLLA